MSWSERERVLFSIAEALAAALDLADNYLDGFVWVTEPEFSELEGIKAASKRARRMLDEVRGVVESTVTPSSDVWSTATPIAGGRGDHRSEHRAGDET